MDATFLIFATLACLGFVPLCLLLNRLWLRLQPHLRGQPAQGTIARSGLLALELVMGCASLLWPPLNVAASVDLLYLGLILLCQFMVYLPVLCVSESGRRFFLMAMIASQPGLPVADLASRYGRDQMLAVRLERLVHWGALTRRGDRYYLRKPGAWLLSQFFFAWGRLLGFRWFS